MASPIFNINIALVKFLLPLLPIALITALLNALHLSQNSGKQSLKVETAVTVIRSVINRKLQLSRIQARANREREIKGPIWIAKASLPPPLESDALDAVLAAIKKLGNGSETFSAPYYSPISGEWTGWRYNLSEKEKRNAPRPNLSEAEQYKSLIAETTSPVTILYFHGGAFFCLDPASHRHITSLLAKRTGGRVFSLRYRLAPQHPFPSALIDALLSYLYLQAPPPAKAKAGAAAEPAFHQPIPASNIVFAGDSAGGNLALSLNLLILTLKRMGINSLRYHGTDVRLEPPAGVATNSPWTEITCSLPSHSRNARYDYLPGPLPQAQALAESESESKSKPERLPNKANNYGYEPMLPRTQPCAIWPASPPRAEIYCSATLITHPLVCPVLVPANLWQGTPSMFICSGEETLMDGILVTARHVLASGTVPVVLAVYEGVPHCGALMFPGSDFGRDCIARWASYCVDAVEDASSTAASIPQKTKRVKTVGTWMKALSHPPVIRDLPVAEAAAAYLTDDQVSAIINRTMERAIRAEKLAQEEWSKEKGQAKL